MVEYKVQKGGKKENSWMIDEVNDGIETKIKADREHSIEMCHR